VLNAESATRDKKRSRVRQLNGIIIGHFVAKGIVTSLSCSLMIDNDDGTVYDDAEWYV
jgi:hypothetical protein